MNNKNARSKIWLYAVVLFTSAFIVLLLTGYSQIKLNRNLNDLNNQVFTKEHEKKQVQLSFANAQEVNGKLTEENKNLQLQIDTLTAELNQIQSDWDASDKLEKSKLVEYDKLCQAQNEYLKGKIVESARMLENVDINLLNSYGNELYGVLRIKAYTEAGKTLLTDGYKLYLKKDYVNASEKLLQSWLYAPDKEHSDKCLYYLAQAEAKSGNISEGVGHMTAFAKQFPSSSYLNAAKRFLSKYSG